MGFVGRENELRRLRRSFRSPNQNVTLVYGRRRVGKSELIKQALQQDTSRSIYYECKETLEENSVASLADLVSETCGLPPLAFPGMEQLLEYLFKQAHEEKLILVLDEYSYLRNAVQGLDSILQTLIDRFADASQLSLVICGSYVEVMRSLLERENPLYGRVDQTIALEPMDCFDSALFYPECSSEDKVRLYSVFGGIPYYSKFIDSSMSVHENIMNLIVEPGARLENEVPFYLSSEISKSTNANEIFGALAEGYSRYKDILSQSHVTSAPAMVNVWGKLISMELAQKQVPINDPGNRRKSSYRIVDGLSFFYYRYLFRYSSQRMVMSPEAFSGRYISNNLESSFIPHRFEEMCRQYPIRQNRAGKMPETFFEIGEYWYDNPATHENGEFDIVTRDPKGYIFYEAKFHATPITTKIMEEEMDQVRRAGPASYAYGSSRVRAAKGRRLRVPVPSLSRTCTDSLQTGRSLPCRAGRADSRMDRRRNAWTSTSSGTA